MLSTHRLARMERCPLPALKVAHRVARERRCSGRALPWRTPTSTTMAPPERTGSRRRGASSAGLALRKRRWSAETSTTCQESAVLEVFADRLKPAHGLRGVDVIGTAPAWEPGRVIDYILVARRSRCWTPARSWIRRSTAPGPRTISDFGRSCGFRKPCAPRGSACTERSRRRRAMRSDSSWRGWQISTVAASGTAVRRARRSTSRAGGCPWAHAVGAADHRVLFVAGVEDGGLEVHGWSPQVLCQ